MARAGDGPGGAGAAMTVTAGRRAWRWLCRTRAGRSVTLAVLLLVSAMAFGIFKLRMPGRSHRGPLPLLAAPAAGAPELPVAEQLRRHVVKLATDIGERHVGRYAELQAAIAYLEGELRASGYPAVQRQTYQAGGRDVSNLVVEVGGTERAAEILVFGAHCDSAPGTPGANDNGSAVAALLILARRFAGQPQPRTLRFVFFVNEEPPFFQTEAMGSWVYAKDCRRRQERIVGMWSLETMGYYSDVKGSQHYPFPFSLFYPDTGNFIGFVADGRSAALLKRTIGSFRKHAQFPSEGVAAPDVVPGLGWSDHWAFWQEGYPAVMITDTAPFRYPHYHEATDTPAQLDYERLGRVVDGLTAVVRDLATDRELT